MISEHGVEVIQGLEVGDTHSVIQEQLLST